MSAFGSRSASAISEHFDLYTGNANPELARKIGAYLGRELGRVEVFEFANENIFVKIEDNARDRDVFLIQPTSSPVQKSIMELLIMIDAFKRASAGRITAVIPYYAYGRSDKKDQPRVPITARLIADMISVAGADRVLTMDLHAGQIQGFFSIPVDHMTSLPLFARHFRDLGLTGTGVVSVAPDAGRAKHAVRFAEMIEADFAIMHKSRPTDDVVVVTEVTGRVRDKIAIIGDDVTTTGSTLIAGAEALMEHGAKDVWVFVTHALLSSEGLERLRSAGFAGIVVTDTLPVDPLQKPDNMTVLTVSGLLAETIMNVFADDSVSAIFGGENQLF